LEATRAFHRPSNGGLVVGRRRRELGGVRVADASSVELLCSKKPFHSIGHLQTLYCGLILAAHADTTLKLFDRFDRYATDETDEGRP
jgi:hypothetical protein